MIHKIELDQLIIEALDQCNSDVNRINAFMFARIVIKLNELIDASNQNEKNLYTNK